MGYAGAILWTLNDTLICCDIAYSRTVTELELWIRQQHTKVHRGHKTWASSGASVVSTRVILTARFKKSAVLDHPVVTIVILKTQHFNRSVGIRTHHLFCCWMKTNFLTYRRETWWWHYRWQLKKILGHKTSKFWKKIAIEHFTGLFWTISTLGSDKNGLHYSN